MATTLEAVADLIQIAGYNRIASDVQAGKVDPRHALAWVIKCRLTAGDHRPSLQRALDLLGGPLPMDHIDLRKKLGRRVEVK